MGYGAVMFDLDGTLLDTLADLANSMNAVLERMGFAVHPVEAYKVFVGAGLEMLVRRALPEGKRDDKTVRAGCDAMRQEYGLRWAETTRPYEGVAELLDEIAARGVRTAVFSNKPDELTKLCVEKLLPRWRFEVVRGAVHQDRAAPSEPPNLPFRPAEGGAGSRRSRRTVVTKGVPRKPDPSGALEIAREMDVPPSQFLYLGDTGTDMKTAVAAGMFPVGAAWGFRSEEELRANGAMVIVRSPGSVLDLL